MSGGDPRHESLEALGGIVYLTKAREVLQQLRLGMRVAHNASGSYILRGRGGKSWACPPNVWSRARSLGQVMLEGDRIAYFDADLVTKALELIPRKHESGWSKEQRRRRRLAEAKVEKYQKPGSLPSLDVLQ